MKWLHFAFVGGSFPRSPSRLNSARYLHNVQAPDVLNLNVGGVKYSLLHDDIRKYPSTLFNQFANESGPNNAYHPIDRDGAAFRFVQAFMVAGQLPRDSMGMHTLDVSTLDSIKSEAEYFNFDALARECRTLCTVPRKYIKAFERQREKDYITAVRECEPMVPMAYSPDLRQSLVVALRDAWAPACTVGSYNVGPKSVYEDFSLIRTHTLEEFVEAVEERVRPEKGAHTLEIEYDQVRDIVNRLFYDSSDPRHFHLGKNLITRLRRVDIHKAGASYTNRASHDATIHNETHIGTVIGTVVGFSEKRDRFQFKRDRSQFRGGQIQVKSGNHTVDLSEDAVPNSKWSTYPAFYVAMDRTCTYSMSPVTSGTRVSLVYDIYENRTTATNETDGLFVNLREGGLEYPFMSIVHNEEQRLYGELNCALKDNDSVTIGLLHSYPVSGTTCEHLKQSDRVLYDALIEKYDVEIVAATIHHDTKKCYTAGLHSEHIVDEVVAGRPERIRCERRYKNMLVVPHSLTSSHQLDQVQTMTPAGPCGCYDIEYEYDTLYLVSGLRIRERGGKNEKKPNSWNYGYRMSESSKWFADKIAGKEDDDDTD